MNKLTLLATLAKNVGIGCADNLSLGMASAFKNTINEIAEGTKVTNEALYYMQVKTFLETVDLDQDEINQFFEKNKDNNRLGIEIFKILEDTFLEQQAKFIAKSFQKFVRGIISNEDLYQYFHVIEQLNRHLLTLIEQDLENLHSYYRQHYLTIKFDDLGIMNFFDTNVSRNHALQFIGFIVVEPSDTPITFSGALKPEVKYRRTQLYLNFYRNIMIDSEENIM